MNLIIEEKKSFYDLFARELLLELRLL